MSFCYLCRKTAELEKQGKSLCTKCSPYYPGIEYPLRDHTYKLDPDAILHLTQGKSLLMRTRRTRAF